MNKKKRPPHITSGEPPKLKFMNKQKFSVLLMIAPFKEHLVLVFRDFGIGHGVALKASLLGLNADIEHGILRGVGHATVAIRGNANHRAFCNGEHIVVHLKLPFAGKYYIVFLVTFV
jgi:hypothetical protein